MCRILGMSSISRWPSLKHQWRIQVSSRICDIFLFAHRFMFCAISVSYFQNYAASSFLWQLVLWLSLFWSFSQGWVSKPSQIHLLEVSTGNKKGTIICSSLVRSTPFTKWRLNLGDFARHVLDTPRRDSSEGRSPRGCAQGNRGNLLSTGAGLSAPTEEVLMSGLGWTPETALTHTWEMNPSLLITSPRRWGKKPLQTFSKLVVGKSKQKGSFRSLWIKRLGEKKDIIVQTTERPWSCLLKGAKLGGISVSYNGMAAGDTQVLCSLILVNPFQKQFPRVRMIRIMPNLLQTRNCLSSGWKEDAHGNRGTWLQPQDPQSH